MNHRDTPVYKAAVRLRQACHRIVKLLPPDEEELGRQLREASRSVPSNSSEGSGRYGPRELLHGLSVAKGSLDEVHDRMDNVAELALVDEDSLTDVYALVDDVSRQLGALSRDLRKRYGK